MSPMLVWAQRPVVAAWVERHSGFRGTWTIDRSVSFHVGPWSLGLSLTTARNREKPGAPDWADPTEDPDYMCPNCVTPWKCNGPHLVEPGLAV